MDELKQCCKLKRLSFWLMPGWDEEWSRLRQRAPLPRATMLTRSITCKRGVAKLTVVSQTGKEATITCCSSAGDFIGEESIAAVAGLRDGDLATAITGCVAPRSTRAEMIRVMHEEHAFSDFFLSFLLTAACEFKLICNQLFNSSVRRGWRGFCC